MLEKLEDGQRCFTHEESRFWSPSTVVGAHECLVALSEYSGAGRWLSKHQCTFRSRPPSEPGMLPVQILDLLLAQPGQFSVHVNLVSLLVVHLHPEHQ